MNQLLPPPQGQLTELLTQIWTNAYLNSMTHNVTVNDLGFDKFVYLLYATGAVL